MRGGLRDGGLSNRFQDVLGALQTLWKKGKNVKKTGEKGRLPGRVARHRLNHHIWEKESIHRPAPVRNFSLPKKWGPQKRDFGIRYGLPGFYKVFRIHHRLGKFLSGARKVLQKILFRWWYCTPFFLLSISYTPMCGSSITSCIGFTKSTPCRYIDCASPIRFFFTLQRISATSAAL